MGTGDVDNYDQPQRIHLESDSSESPGVTGDLSDSPGVAGVACGGRHTFIWLDNGHMYSFGNNYFAQLGYDFRIKKYKENQVGVEL